MARTQVDSDQVKREPICIIGAGPAGLITAHVLLDDGFQNVQVLTQDSSVGGVWAKGRIYPGMHINNVHGQFRFSSLAMPPPSNAAATGGRLSGGDLSRYMEEFYEKCLLQQDHKDSPRQNVVRFNTEVVRIRRSPNEKGWSILVKDTISNETETLHFPRIVLCTGGCNAPKFPEGLDPDSAATAGFHGPVVHSSQAWANMDSIIASARTSPDDNDHSASEAPGQKAGTSISSTTQSSTLKRNDSTSKDASPKAKSPRTVVVVGGGKSAQDISTYLATQNVDVTVVCNELDLFLASPKPLPVAIRQSRFLSVFWPTIDLKTRLEKFLHRTWLGSRTVRWFWSNVEARSFKTYSIPEDSPLRNTASLFWDTRTGDDGIRRNDSFPGLANEGKIRIISPAYVTAFDGDSVTLSTGERIEAASVIASTGFTSSWDGVFEEKDALDIGLTQVISPESLEQYTWDYRSLSDPPKPGPSKSNSGGRLIASGLYKGLVPAKRIAMRDFVVNGAIYSVNSGYVFEVCAHWISAYLLGEKMTLPSSSEDAVEHTVRQLAWMKRRYPRSSTWINPSHASAITSFSWPQGTDDLLEDMHLPSMRSGGNWFTWLFQPISSDELRTLGEERRRKRERES